MQNRQTEQAKKSLLLLQFYPAKQIFIFEPDFFFKVLKQRLDFVFV